MLEIGGMAWDVAAHEKRLIESYDEVFVKVLEEFLSGNSTPQRARLFIIILPVTGFGLWNSREGKFEKGEAETHKRRK